MRFHRKVLPLIKTNFIETGKVRFIYRDYPTSTAALRGAVAAHCAGTERYYTMLDALYYSVGDWSLAEDIDNALVEIATSLNIKRGTFIECLNNPQQTQNVNNERDEGVLQYDVSGTPSFVINGNLVRGLQTFEEMKLLIEQALTQSD